MVGFLRRQHRSRLVKNQHIGATIKRLENFNPLLQANAQLAHHRIRIDFKAVLLIQLFQVRARLDQPVFKTSPPSAPRTMFSSTVKVSTSMKC